MLSTAAILSSQGCTSAPPISMHDMPSKNADVERNMSCTALSNVQVSKVTGSSIEILETASSSAQRCRYILKDGQWFDVIFTPVPDTKWYSYSDCDDKQNGPSYERIYHPNCFATAGPYWLHLQSSKYFGLPKPIMKQLLDSVVENLAASAGAKVFNGR